MQTCNTIRQMGLVRVPPQSRRLCMNGITNGIGLKQHAVSRSGRLRLFSSTSALASDANRANTIGFIGLGAMGNHMVCQLQISSYQSKPTNKPSLLQLSNLISRYAPSRSGQEVSFALCDVNEATVDSIIKHHGSENPNVPLIKCICKCRLRCKACYRQIIC